MRSVMRRTAPSGRAVSDTERTLLFTLQELERRILSKELTGSTYLFKGLF